MASWSNETGEQFPHDMDSAGKKLKVTGNTGGSSFQAEFKDESSFGHAVKVDGALFFYRNTILQARLQTNLEGGDPPVLNINTGAGSDQPTDPGIVIGQATSLPDLEGNQGNQCTILSRLIGLRPGLGPNNEFPVAINGPIKTQGINGTGIALETNGGILANQLDLFDPATLHLDIGKTNAAEIRIGRGAGTTSGDGSTIRMKKNVIIQQVDENHPGSLNVEGNIQARQGTFTSNVLAGGNGSFSGGLQVNGETELNGNTRLTGPILALSAIQADVEVGTSAQNHNFTVYGISKLKDLVFMEQDATVNGDLDVTGRITSGAISTSGDLVRTGSFSAGANAVTLQQPTTIDKTLVVKENADFFKDLSMNGNSVKMEKPGQMAVSMIAQNDRMEFFINGKLKFYIDEDGGHNA